MLVDKPPILWTVLKARITLFSIKMDDLIPLEKILDTEMVFVSNVLRKLNFSQINCRIIARTKLHLPRRQILGLIKNRLQENSISLLFQKQIPELILNINASKCQGYLEIGKMFAYPTPVKVHHTPLSPAVSYALFHLARKFQTENSLSCLDPMCGNGTVLLVGIEESRIMKTPFFGMGLDSDPSAIANARENLHAFAHDIVLLESSIEHFEPSSLPLQPNLILTHPPYGFAPIINEMSLGNLYDALFQLFLKFPQGIYGVVTPHQSLILKLVEKYHIKTEILRPFQQKTLLSCLWVGRCSQK